MGNYPPPPYPPPPGPPYGNDWKYQRRVLKDQARVQRDMLRAHVSQFGWVIKQHGIDDYTGSMEKWSARRGREFAVAYAEGFRQYTGTPYPRSPLLQELVGAALRYP